MMKLNELYIKLRIVIKFIAARKEKKRRWSRYITVSLTMSPNEFCIQNAPQR